MLSFGMLGGLSVCPTPMMASVTQQTIKVSGQVVDQDGEPLIGATVKVQGAQSGAITDFTVDGCHLEFDNVLGAEDNSTSWWGAHSDMINVPVGKTYSTRIRNFTSGQNNWNNFVVVLTRADNSEYAVVRSDNYGWGLVYRVAVKLTGGHG